MRQLEIRYMGEHIHGSPFETTVAAAAATASTTSVHGPAVAVAHAGQLASFAVQTCDAFGNPSASGASPEVQLLEGDEVAVEARVTAGGEGTYAATYEAASAGYYALEVTVGGEHIAGSPFPLSVLPGPAEAHTSHALSPLPTTLVAGSMGALRVQCCDRMGNGRSSGGDPLLCEIWTDPACRRQRPLLPHEEAAIELGGEVDPGR